MVLIIWPWYRLCWIIQKSQKCIFEWSKEPKKRVLAIFWSLVCWIDLILHIVIVLNVPNNLAMISAMLDHSKVTKMHFWLIQRVKKDVFGHFLEFGLLDQLDIPYCDSTWYFPTFCNVTMSWRIIQKSQKCSFEWSNVPKNRFLTIFRS